jgi:hypothetical protein
MHMVCIYVHVAAVTGLAHLVTQLARCVRVDFFEELVADAVIRACHPLGAGGERGHGVSELLAAHVSIAVEIDHVEERAQRRNCARAATSRDSTQRSTKEGGII